MLGTEETNGQTVAYEGIVTVRPIRIDRIEDHWFSKAG